MKYLDGNSIVGDGKVYATRKEYELYQENKKLQELIFKLKTCDNCKGGWTDWDCGECTDKDFSNWKFYKEE